MDSHIIIVIQNGILPVAGIAFEPSGNIIATFTTDIRRFIVHLHAVLPRIYREETGHEFADGTISKNKYFGSNESS